MYRLQHRGHSISYEMFGRNSNAHRVPVVLIHGLASNKSRWREFMAHTTLKDERAVISLDLRGHGESMTRVRSALEDWSNDLAALLTEHKAEKAIVIGHSMGAQTALFFGTQFASKLAGLVLIDPVFEHAVLPAKRGFIRNAPLYRLAAAALRGINRIGIYRRHLPPLDLEAMDIKAREALAKNDPIELAKFVALYSSTRADLKHIPHANYLQDLVEMFRPLPSLAVITCPVLALRSTVAGYQDDLLVLEKLREMATVQIESVDCHHWPITERPLEVRQMIENWVRRTQL